MRVLIVDDSKTARFAIRRSLEAANYEVVEADSGRAALATLRAQSVDLVTLDIEMPDLDGYQTCSKIRHMAAEADDPQCMSSVPILFLTSNDTIEGRVRGFDAGCTEFIQKSVPPNTLLYCVERLLHPEGQYKDCTALVIEDSMVVRQIILQSLQSLGVSARCCTDGQDALDLLITSDRRPDLIVCDFELPKVCGTEIVQKVRKKFGDFDTPIIMISSVSDRSGALDFFAAGATDFLQKPFLKEELIARVRVHLDRQELVRQLRAATVQAQEAAKAKAMFLANMSHEIRTPLNGVIGMTDLALETNLDTDQRELISTAKTSAESLLKIINDILDFSKVEAGKVEFDFHPFQLSSCLEQISALLNNQAEKQSIQLTFNLDKKIPNWLFGDELRLRQILINLIANALKFTHSEGAVILTTSLKKLTTSEAIIRFGVLDTGIGIAPEKQSQIFDSFSQADSSTTRKYGGTGLGLSISADLVRLMGGELEIRSKENCGSHFFFTLPISLVPEGAMSHEDSKLATTERSGVSDSPLRILVAEDNSVNQQLIRRLLEKKGHQVTLVEDGTLALQELESKHFDLIFMDIQMPKLGGIETTAEIRKLEQAGRTKIPIIALTAHAVKGDREKYIEAGMDEYISKPINKLELYALLEKFSLPDKSTQS